MGKKIEVPDTIFRIGDVAFLCDDGSSAIVTDIYYSLSSEDWYVRYKNQRGETYSDLLESFEECFTKEKPTTW